MKRVTIVLLAAACVLGVLVAATNTFAYLRFIGLAIGGSAFGVLSNLQVA